MFSVIVLKNLLSGRNILIAIILSGFLYCYISIESKNNTILEQSVTIAQQQLQIQQMTVTKQQQQEIMNQVTEQVAETQKTQNKTIKIIEKQVIAPGCDNSIKYLKDEAENIKW